MNLHSTVKRIAAITAAVFVLTQITACGTLIGLPAHGGGKRFATEQRLVSASIRASLKDIDVSALQGKRVAVHFDLIADEGGGNMAGGRISPGFLFSAGYVMNPASTTDSTFQVFNLQDSGKGYNGSSGGSSTTSTTHYNDNSSQQGNSSSSQTDRGSSSSSGTNNQTGTNTSTTTGSGSGTNNSSSTTVGGIGAGTTTGNGSYNQNSTSTTNGSNTSSGSNSQNSAYNNSSNASSSQSSSGNSSGSSVTEQSSGFSNSGYSGYNNTRQALSATPTNSITRVEGDKLERSVNLTYKGLGEHQNFSVPKSDASLLMGLVRAYLQLNGVQPVAPNDKSADAVLYVLVDIFGTVRSRFDAYVYNNETVKAETSLEMYAFDKEGQLIMAPVNANREAKYQEHYLLWAGPLTTQEKVIKGPGLLVDFSDQMPPNAKEALKQAQSNSTKTKTAQPEVPVSKFHFMGK